VTHPLNLRPALPSEGVTSMQDGWADTVDHLLYSEGHLVPTAALALVSHGQLVAEGGMPSAQEPSDHQLIAARFAFVDRRAPLP
jgi:mRNA deadenylase 3'-5' endonuclease subunit Ccr4